MSATSTLVRSAGPGSLLIREAEGAAPVLFGHFAVFNRWTEIDSWFEGHFFERIAFGAFLRTFARDRSAMRVLLNHGRDPSVGAKPLGSILTLREDEIGAAYEVPLFDTTYNADLVPALRAGGAYGASFRFEILGEEWIEEPTPTEANPLGLPERTIKEARVFEFGPVTFPAYAGATAGVRSAAA
jgi:HK97 family phage prohead protease